MSTDTEPTNVDPRACALPLVALDPGEICPRCELPAGVHRRHPTNAPKPVASDNAREDEITQLRAENARLRSAMPSEDDVRDVRTIVTFARVYGGLSRAVDAADVVAAWLASLDAARNGGGR